MDQGIYSKRFGFIGKVRCFGGANAAQTEITKNRKGFSTVSIEFASAGGGGRYDWNDKMTIQLTSADLPLWLATLAGKNESLKLANYGEERNKGLELRPNPQAAGMMLVGLSPKGARPVPIRPSDIYWMSLQALAVIQDLAPGVESLSAIHLSGQLSRS